MRNINEIKNGMQSKNQSDWITFDELNWIIGQTEKLDTIIDKIENRIVKLEDDCETERAGELKLLLHYLKMEVFV